MNDVLSKLKIAINKKMYAMGEKFWEDGTLPSFDFEGVNIINPFLSENFMEEVNPIRYYNMKINDIVKFSNYYL